MDKSLIQFDSTVNLTFTPKEYTSLVRYAMTAVVGFLFL